MGRRIRQKLASLGRILAFDAQSPTGSWDGCPALVDKLQRVWHEQALLLGCYGQLRENRLV
jgi:hypothetical protein